jgi:predicted nucleic acid-binding protein
VARLYLLDTNILSDLVRQPQGRVAERIADVGEANVFTSVIVACELHTARPSVPRENSHPRSKPSSAARTKGHADRRT